MSRGRRRVLFVCAHNSARSQMAEGFLRAMAGDRFEAASAGTEPAALHPLDRGPAPAVAGHRAVIAVAGPGGPLY